MSEEKTWKEGWPKSRGLYRCRVDGEEKILTHHYCALNNRHWWSTTDGHDVVGFAIEWREKFRIE